VNVGALVYFKYSNFFVGELNRALGTFGISQIHWVAVTLPIGISFFTFHKISYVVDIYRRIVPPASNVITYGLYITLFPQLIAGPIIRYHDIDKQLVDRSPSVDDVWTGVIRFCHGFGKKVLIADTMGLVADGIFRLKPDQLSTGWAWLGIISYSYQIYFDFSGYSDMAIGIGRICGFTFLENFDQPYRAQTITEFGRRWHISLSRWMRDYLYIPLGGNRGAAWRTYLNLWLVFFFSGLWHGASWNFVIWGMFHGLFLVMDKLFWLRISTRLPVLINTILTFLIVQIGWVFFRCETLGSACAFLRRMFDPVHFLTVQHFLPRGLIIQNHGIVILLVASLICFAHLLPSGLGHRLRSHVANVPLLPRLSFQFAGGMACLILGMLALATTSYTPFIYFRF
jgi:alginate O-acetyltransferase complex protein AlgI